MDIIWRINTYLDLTEFRTLVSNKLNIVSNDMKFVKHKIHETKDDVFTI